MEPFLNELQNMNGYRICGENISYFAYADDDMEALLCKVNEYLKMHKMQLQPTKRIIYSNYNAKKFYIEESNTQIQISTVNSKQDIKYLGVSMPLNNNKIVYSNILKEIEDISQKIQSKKLSSCIATYIIQTVIYPLISYCLMGRRGPREFLTKIMSICTRFSKKSLNLPKTFSHYILFTTFLPFGIRLIEDICMEREISNFMYRVNSNIETH